METLSLSSAACGCLVTCCCGCGATACTALVSSLLSSLQTTMAAFATLPRGTTVVAPLPVTAERDAAMDAVLAC
jgi:hypothetical protein